MKQYPLYNIHKMVSNPKRMRYVSENTTTSEEDSFEDSVYHAKEENGFTNFERTKRKPRCLSKNALMARENRLKKKLYVNKLENQVSTLKQENRNLSSVVRNQALLVADLEKEVKYLKSIIANSSDIKNLIRNIHNSTGMSVSSSLDKNLSLKKISVTKEHLGRAATKLIDEDINLDLFPNSDSLIGEDLNLSINWCEIENLTEPPLTTTIDEDIFNKHFSHNLDEHNYTAVNELQDHDEDVGVCLHVSKHRVSLEFCTKCSNQAQESWNHL